MFFSVNVLELINFTISFLNKLFKFFVRFSANFNSSSNKEPSLKPSIIIFLNIKLLKVSIMPPLGVVYVILLSGFKLLYLFNIVSILKK